MSKKKVKTSSENPPISAPPAHVSAPKNSVTARKPLPRFTILCICVALGAILGAIDPLWWLGPDSPSSDQANALRLICALLFAAAGAFLGGTVLAIIDRPREKRTG